MEIVQENLSIRNTKVDVRVNLKGWYFDGKSHNEGEIISDDKITDFVKETLLTRETFKHPMTGDVLPVCEIVKGDVTSLLFDENTVDDDLTDPEPDVSAASDEDIDSDSEQEVEEDDLTLSSTEDDRIKKIKKKKKSKKKKKIRLDD